MLVAGQGWVAQRGRPPGASPAAGVVLDADLWSVGSGGIGGGSAADLRSEVAGLAPHDLRRTFAKLAHRGGAPIEQVQQSLGYASVQTTVRYLGVELDLQHAPSDYIVLDVEM